MTRYEGKVDLTQPESDLVSEFDNLLKSLDIGMKKLPYNPGSDNAGKLNSSYKLRKIINGILLPKSFWPTVTKKCSSEWGKLLKFEAEGQEFAKCLRSLEQFIQTVKGQNNFW